jgi:hypothetical protein
LITDFAPGTDKLDLSALGEFRFLGNAAFDGQADALHTISSGGNTILEGDLNGDKAVDFQIEFSGNVTLTSADFTSGSVALSALQLADVLDIEADVDGSLDDVLKSDGDASDTLALTAAEGGGAAETATLAGCANVRITVEPEIVVAVS